MMDDIREFEIVLIDDLTLAICNPQKVILTRAIRLNISVYFFFLDLRIPETPSAVPSARPKAKLSKTNPKRRPKEIPKANESLFILFIKLAPFNKIILILLYQILLDLAVFA